VRPAFSNVVPTRSRTARVCEPTTILTTGIRASGKTMLSEGALRTAPFGGRL
jgi:hypothetical protein